MRYLKLENHLVPVLNISRIEREYEDSQEVGEEDLLFEKVTVWMKDGSSFEPDETFDQICECLNPEKSIPK